MGRINKGNCIRCHTPIYSDQQPDVVRDSGDWSLQHSDRYDCIEGLKTEISDLNHYIDHLGSVCVFCDGELLEGDERTHWMECEKHPAKEYSDHLRAKIFELHKKYEEGKRSSFLEKKS